MLSKDENSEWFEARTEPLAKGGFQTLLQIFCDLLLSAWLLSSLF